MMMMMMITVGQWRRCAGPWLCVVCPSPHLPLRGAHYCLCFTSGCTGALGSIHLLTSHSWWGLRLIPTQAGPNTDLWTNSGFLDENPGGLRSCWSSESRFLTCLWAVPGVWRAPVKWWVGTACPKDSLARMMCDRSGRSSLLMNWLTHHFFPHRNDSNLIFTRTQFFERLHGYSDVYVSE